MKIKNSVYSISPDASIVLMCIALLVACPIRIFQMLKNMDATTGFFEDYSSVTIIILYAVLAFVSVLILCLSFMSGRIPAAVAPQGKRVFLGIGSLVFAATLFYDAISNYLPSEESTATIIQNAQSVSTLHHVHAVFAFLSCCYFLVFAVSYFFGTSYHKKLKILSLAPLAWAIVNVLERITVIISIMRVSELFLELCSFVFLMMFFLSFARVASDVNCKGSMWSVIACGCVSVMFILTYSIPRIMLMLTGNSDSLVSGYPVDFTAVGCALFAVIFVVTVLRCGYSVEDVEEMHAELDQAQKDAEGVEENDGEDDVPMPVPLDDDGNVIISAPASNDEESEE